MDLAVSPNIEPPPLLFGARPSSSNSSSQHQSNHAQSFGNSQSPPPSNNVSQLPPVMDLSNSTTLPEPEGQDHDRSDTQMDNTSDTPNGHVSEPLHAEHSASGISARQQDDQPETMDTTPDSQEEPSTNGIQASEGIIPAPVPNVATEAPETEHATQQVSDDGITRDSVVSIVEESMPLPGGEVARTQSPPVEPTNSGESDIPPPPPPAPPVDIEPPQADGSDNQRDYDDSDTSSDEEDEPRPIRWEEDLSAPDEEELKEIEEKGPEISALDYDHWQTEFFPSLDDPEHVPGEVGRIDWTVTNVHGSLEKPNKETVMTSPKMRLGGLDWNIKYYPRGNDTEQLSIYIECSKPRPERETGMAAPGRSHEEHQVTSSVEATNGNPESDALPAAQNDTGIVLDQLTTTSSRSTDSEELEEGDPAASESVGPPDNTWGTAAQFGVVIYNPDEPRVKYGRGNYHRFCAKSPDWGWTRFHGPHAQIHQRFRGERQALLRNDTLAFSAYVRIIKDETGALWEAGNINDWDSLAKTGVNAIGSSESYSNVVATALQAWLLFPPFMKIVRGAAVPDHRREPLATSKPIMAALQKILYMLQSPNSQHTSVPIECLANAFSYYGVPIGSGDVVEFWEILRRLMEDELRGTEMEGKLETVFDGLLNEHAVQNTEAMVPLSDTKLSSLSAGKAPCFRVPVKGVDNVQTAIAKSLGTDGDKMRRLIVQPPVLLQIELDRQVFDTQTRRWKKLVDKVEIDEEIDLRPWMTYSESESKYVLYGFIVHAKDLQSGFYYSVVRPGGPGTRWLTCQDHKSYSNVMGVTHKQAFDQHCGISQGKKCDGTEPVAYVLMYVRKDAAQEVLEGIPEPWQAPRWIKDETDSPRPTKATRKAVSENERKEVDDKIQLHIYDSSLFNDRIGDGLIDFNDPTMSTTGVHKVNVPVNESAIRQEIIAQIPGFNDSYQGSLIWMMDYGDDASLHHPHLLCGNKASSTYEKISRETSACRVWLHTPTKADTPFSVESKATPPPSAPVNPTTVEDPGTPSSSSTASSRNSIVEGATALEPATVDVEAVPNFWLGRAAESTALHPAVSTEDTPMVEASSNDIVPGVDVAASESVPSPELTNNALNPVSEQDSQPSPAMVSPHVQDAEMEDPTAETSPAVSNETTEVIESSSNQDTPAVQRQVTVGDGGLAITQQSINADDVEMEDSYVPETLPTAGQGLDREPSPTTEILPNAASLPPTTYVDEIKYFFLKQFDAENQILRAVGSYIARHDEDMEVCIRRLLDLPKDKGITLWHETAAGHAKPLPPRRTFSDEFHEPGPIIIVQDVLSEAGIVALEEDAKYADPQQYLSALVMRRSHPACFDGSTTHCYFSGAYTSGTFRNGRLHGHGTRISLTGETYTGNLVASKPHGQGSMTYQNRDVYTGQFRNGEMHGQGKMVYEKTGNVYEGGWRHGKRHGKGTMHFEVADEEMSLCQICYEGEQDALFYDCGHVCACLDCARQVDSCPVCRRHVVAVVKIFRT